MGLRSASVMLACVLCLTLCSSCSGNAPAFGTPLPVQRYVSVLPGTLTEAVYLGHKPFGPIGTEVGIVMDYPTALTGAPSSGLVLNKAEIDWGDGGGFVDHTADIAKWWRGAGPEDPNNLSRHTYVIPGAFTINARITYWDGVTVTESESDRWTITVMDSPQFVLARSYPLTDVTFTDGIAIGPAGTEVGMALLYLRNIPGAPKGVFGKDEIISKAEIDWGDGGGFEVYTQDAYDLWDIGLGSEDPQYLTHHTYSDPGEYTMIGRLTYWDGTVVTEEEFDRATIRITP